MGTGVGTGVRWLIGSITLLLLLPASAHAQVAGLTFGRPAIADVGLSPSGDRAAMAVWAKGTQLVAIIDVETQAPIRTINIGSVYADWVVWANEDRVLVGVSRAQTVGGVFKIRGSRVVSVDPNGEADPIVLLRAEADDAETVLSMGRLAHLLPDEPGHVLVPGPSGDETALYRVNVLTGESDLVAEGGKRTYGFVTDGQGAPSIRFDHSGNGRFGIVLRRDQDGAWRTVRRFRFGREWRDTTISKEFRPIVALPDGGGLVSVARPDGERHVGLWAYDLEGDRFLRRLGGPPEGDVDAAVLDARTNALLGYVATGHVPQSFFFDETMQAHAEALRAAAGEHGSVLFTDVSAGRNAAIVFVSSPTDPGSYYLYDFEAQEASELGAAYAGLSGYAGTLFGQSRVETVPSRDGTVIEAYVTNPSPMFATSGPIPLVVMPHGGPEARDTLAFDPVVQHLATEGFRVIRPYFRGSTGKGRAFAEAGYGAWGGVMHDDVIDTVLWAYESGLGQPSHTCVMGASYGAYASMLAAARRPELFSCAVAMSGPADLGDFLRDARRRYGASSDTYAYWVQSMGGSALDKARLADASPSSHADDWRVPLLLVHGIYDEVVPFSQSQDFYKRLKRKGAPVEFLSWRAGHQLGGEGPSLGATRRVTAFLETHISRDKPEVAWEGVGGGAASR